MSSTLYSICSIQYSQSLDAEISPSRSSPSGLRSSCSVTAPRTYLAYLNKQVRLTTLNGAEVLSMGQWEACRALREAFSSAEDWTKRGFPSRGRRCAVIFLDEADGLLARYVGSALLVRHSPEV